MDLKAGFKESNIGPIPVSWQERRLADIAVIGSGGTPSREVPHYWNGTIPWITTSQIDFNEISKAEQYISEAGLRNSAAKVLPPGTLLMALYGQGKTRGKVGVLTISAATNQACASISLDASISADYVRHFLASRYEAIRSASNGGSQDNLSSQIVRGLPIALPPLSEQRGIAAALSDADGLLGSLDRLIAKKRDLKQATMQQFLTGQTRLPGFSGKWEYRRLTDVIGALETGVSVNSVEDDGTAGHDGPCILKTSAVAGGRFIPQECKRIAPGDLTRARLNPKRHTVLISRMNTPDLVGECGYVNRDYPNLFVPDRLWMTRFRPDADIDGLWLSYVLSTSTLKRQIGAAATGTSGSMKNLSKQAFLQIPLTLPSGREQKAIASVLADMDAALTVLEQRHNKTRLLKQGMMQELLTGRTRLL